MESSKSRFNPTNCQYGTFYTTSEYYFGGIEVHFLPGTVAEERLLGAGWLRSSFASEIGSANGAESLLRMTSPATRWMAVGETASSC